LPENEDSKMLHIVKVVNHLHVSLIVKGRLRPEVVSEENLTAKERP
jgi:hypothetical protein